MANFCLTKLRNGVDLNLTREEFRASRISFSLFGEDLAVLRWLNRTPESPKVYVDAGCFHPVTHSNTLLLHKSGWRGVNIDMNEETIRVFNEQRLNDINIAAALSDSEREMVRFGFSSDPTSLDRLGRPDEGPLKSLLGHSAKHQTSVKTTTLNRILARTAFDRIGYLDIDVEGHDLEVLKGLDLDRYTPAVITIETLPEQRPETIEYLAAHRYELEEILELTLLFVRRT